MDRTLRVEGLVNGRDLGGLPLRGGGRTPPGVFFRSETVDRVTPAGWARLHAAGVRTVVDLRQDAERAADTGVRPDWLHTVAVDLDHLGNTAFWADYWTNGKCGTALYYLPHLAAMPDRAVAALTALLRAPAGGVLFHCRSGRDRTGLIALLLLTAAGAEPESIVADYLATVALGEARAAAEGEPSREPECEALCAGFGTSTEGAFRAALTGLDLDRVLAGGGMSAADTAALRGWQGRLPQGGRAPGR